MQPKTIRTNQSDTFAHIRTNYIFLKFQCSQGNLRGPPSASHPDFPVAVEGLGQQWDFSVDNCIKFVQEMYTKSSQIIVLECPGVGKKNVM